MRRRSWPIRASYTTGTAAASVGTRYKNWVPSTVSGPIEWDAYYLYPADAAWTGDAPPMHLAAGRTILETRRSLEAAISHLQPWPRSRHHSRPWPLSPFPSSRVAFARRRITACAHERSCFLSPS